MATPCFRLFAGALLLAANITQLPAQSTSAADEAGTIDYLPAEEETALALSAAPEHLRASAAAHALGPDGFSVTQEGTNGFACVVNRDHPRNRKPTCYDAEGARTILPKVLFMGELMAKGVPIEAIQDSVADGFRSGRFGPPERPGIAYMLSDGIRRFDPATGQYSSFPPHVMFYAPNVSNDDIATDWSKIGELDWMPFVAYEGPHGMFVVRVGS